MRQLTVAVDGVPVTVDVGTSVLEACRAAGKDVPTLCYTETLEPAYACRACVVEVGPGALIPACAREATDGMDISTESGRVERARSMVFELLASTTDLDRVPETTSRWFPGDTSRMGSPVSPRGTRHAPTPGHHPQVAPGEAATTVEPVKIEDDLYVRDYAACILCFRCVDVCGEQHQNSFAIATAGRGFDARISTEFDRALPDSACVYCGNCIAVCPTGALVGKIQWDMRVAGTWDPARHEVKRSVCGYCGVGCSLDVTTQDGSIVEVASPSDHDVTLGNLCIKGRFGWQFVYSDD